MESKTFFDNFEAIANAPGGIARLRSLVLSLAMSGQLVQRDSDWVEERLGECVVLRNGRAYSQTELLDTGTPVIRIQNLNGGKNWYYSNLDLPPEKLCEDGDLLFAWSASFGPYIWSGPTAIFHYHIWKIEVGPQLHKEFLFYLLQHLTEEIKKSSHGLAMLHMTKKKMENLVVSFPSVSEQLRVVDKVREIFLLCEELEAAQNQRNSIRSAARKSATDAISTATTPEELETAWRRISNNWELIFDTPESVESLRRLVLNLAVCGELTPQIPDDGDAEHFAAEFEANQQKMVREGTISNPRFQRGQTIVNVPYEIPNSWRWYYLGEVGAVVGGGTPSTSVSSYWSHGESIPWLTPADMRKQTSRYISRGTRDITEKGLAESSAQLLPLGTVLFSSRAPIGHVGIAAQPLATNQGFKSCIPYVPEMSEYIFKFLLHIGPEIDAKATGTTFKEVSGRQVSQILIPVPPLAEQKRIVAKVDELLVLCDQLEAELKVRSQAAEKFARSVVGAA